ncbi:MAG: ATP-grasp domain-containing protein, partial [Bradymonadaceae bacterium]
MATKKKTSSKKTAASSNDTDVATVKAKKKPAKKKAPAPLQTVTRHIGLSLGADLCWPLCYEHIMRELNPAILWDDQEVTIDVERVTIEPFSLAQPCKYDVVLDRLAIWYTTNREWVKKAIIMDGLYVLNNPWSVQSMEKHTSYAAMMHLGMPIPETWMVPPKAYEPHPDLKPTLTSYAKLFNLGKIGEKIGYPLFMKPYDGGGWRGVSYVGNESDLHKRYDESGKQAMHLQKAVDPHDSFVRCVGLGPQTRLVRYDPDAPLHDRYTMQKDFVSDEEASLLRDTTLTINAFFGWDFNSCEALRGGDGIWRPIDFANACPDSQVTSLHYHFPWLVLANLRWSIFCAVTKRPMRRTVDWDPFYAIAAVKDMPYRERLRAYAKIAEERFDTARFEEFCA